MKPLKAKVNWRENYDVEPVLQILVNKIPAYNEPIYNAYKVKGGILYYTEQDGYVDFLFSEFGNHRGFGGRSFTLNTNDGEVTLIGPWSSRAGVVNQLTPIQCVEVSLTDNEMALERGYTFLAGAVTLELAGEAATMAGVKMIKQVYDNGEVYYIPALLDCPFDEIGSDWSSCDYEVLKAIKGEHYYRSEQCAKS